MYLGFLVFTLGQAPVVRNVVAGLSGVVGILLLVGFRVGREERMMLRRVRERVCGLPRADEPADPGGLVDPIAIPDVFVWMNSIEGHRQDEQHNR